MGDKEGEVVLDPASEGVPRLGGAGRDAIAGRGSNTGRCVDVGVVVTELWAEEERYSCR
jgi:hypothetical protein